jgi:ZIP family zinc transporter
VNPAALLPFFSTLAGGYAALRLRHRLHGFMAIASGVVVATAVADLLPEAFNLLGEGAALSAGVAAVVGFIGFSLVEAFVHQTSFEHGDPRSDGHGDEDHHEADDALVRRAPGVSHTAGPSRPGTLLGVLPPLSLIIHSTLDGLAIGLAFQASSSIGLIVLLAVLAHDFADGMNVVTLALDAARGVRLAVVLLIVDALAPVAGAALSLVLTVSPGTLGLLLAAFGGVFLAIGAGHLLPESQHRDPRRGPAMVLLAGAGAAFVLVVRGLAPV